MAIKKKPVRVISAIDISAFGGNDAGSDGTPIDVVAERCRQRSLNPAGKSSARRGYLHQIDINWIVRRRESAVKQPVCVRFARAGIYKSGDGRTDRPTLTLLLKARN